MTKYYKCKDKKGVVVAYFASSVEKKYLHLRCVETKIKTFDVGSYYYLSKEYIGKDISGKITTQCDSSEELFLSISNDGDNE